MIGAPAIGLRTLLTAGVWLALLWIVSALHAVQPPPQWRVDDWQVAQLQPAATAVTPLRLPHEWQASAPDALALRYQAVVQVPAPPAEPWVIYIPSLGMNLAASLNGVPIGDGGSMQEPLARHRFRPLMFRVPPALLKPGANVFALELRSAPPGSGFMQAVFVGPEAALRPYYELRYALKVGYLQVLVIALLVLACVSLGVWRARRRERVYLWHALTSIAASSYALIFAASELPLSSLWWDWARYSTIAWAIAAVTAFGIHFLGLARPRLLRALGWICVLGPLALALIAALDPALFHLVAARAWDTVVLGFGTYAVFLFVRDLWRKADVQSFWMLAAASSLLLGGLHDVLVVNHLLAPFNGHYLHYMVPLPIAVFTWVLLGRFVAAMSESERLNRELAQRVEQKTGEVLRLERERVLAAERERLLRDVHDGAGGQLVSLLARLDNAGEAATPVAAAVRAALDDLRLIIHSLEPSAGDLPSALALLRERLQPACSAAGLTLSWDTAELSAACALGPRNTLQVLRIVQEGVSNVLRHAGASQLSLRAVSRDDALLLEIEDDGRGFDAGVAHPGHGLRNLRHRAEHLGGTIHWQSCSPGTRLEFRMQVGPT